MKQADLVLLPGLDGTGILFRPLIAALPADLRPEVIAYPPDRRLSLDEHARHVLDRLPAGKPVVLAESFSGLVALALLARAPSRIGGVIFICSFAEPPRPLLLRLAPLVSGSGALMRSAPSFLLRQFCLGRDATVEQLNLLREALHAVAPEVLAHRLALVATRQSFGKAPFKTPCHYFQASEDRLVPSAAARWFQQRFERCDLERIPGPHFVLQAKAPECAQKVAGILLKDTRP